MRKFVNYARDNKKTIAKRSLIVGASVLGLIFTAGLFRKGGYVEEPPAKEETPKDDYYGASVYYEN